MELNKIYNQDCFEFMKSLPSECIDLIIADPPYFSTNIKELGDNQWKTVDEYISWFYELLNHSNRILKFNGTIYIYHNDLEIMTDVLHYCKHDLKLKLRNAIVWNKFPTHNNFSRIIKTFGKNRNYSQTFSEHIYYITKQDDFFKTPFSEILINEMNLRNINQKQLSALCPSKTGGLTGWVANKIKGTQIPTEEQWIKICDFFNIKNKYNALLEKFNQMRYKFNQEYIDFKGKSIDEQKKYLKPYSEIWEYKKDDVNGFYTSKPVDMSTNMIKISSNENDLVYIPFAGSGSEIESCIKNNRKWIATEINNQYIEDIIIPKINKH